MKTNKVFPMTTKDIFNNGYTVLNVRTFPRMKQQQAHSFYQQRLFNNPRLKEPLSKAIYD